MVSQVAPGAMTPAARRVGVVVDATASAAPRFVGALAVALPLGLLIQAVVYHSYYRTPVIPVLVWLGMLAAAAWLVPQACARDLTGAESLAAVAIAVVAVTAIGLDRKVAGAPGAPDWTILGTIWLLALVALSSPPRVWIPGSALVAALHAIFIVRLLGTTPVALAQMTASTYITVVLVGVFVALRPTLRAHARVAVRRQHLIIRSAAERAAADAIVGDRRDMLALLEVEALPLLRGIAGGTLDPADPAVRGLCGQHAGTLRRALADRSLRSGGVLERLQPALSAARDRDVPVEVQVIGEPGQPAEDVAHATLAAVDGVLRTLAPQPVTLTIVGSDGGVELFLTFDRGAQDGFDVAGLGRSVPAAAAWGASVEAEPGGAGCLEVHWRTAVPA
jgi:hypothetical protein